MIFLWKSGWDSLNIYLNNKNKYDAVSDEHNECARLFGLKFELDHKKKEKSVISLTKS